MMHATNLIALDRLLVSGCLCAITMLATTDSVWGQVDKASSARKVYEKKCASCHGANGQGTADGYKKPFRGDYSLDELTELIDSTMPQKDPEQCVGDEARQVAEYLFQKFYSPSVRRASAQVELARLTVNQHRNAIADVFARFAPTEALPDPEPRRRRRERPPEPPPKPRKPIPPGPGLRGEYYQSKGMSKADNLVLERVDPHLSFDFGTGSPADRIASDQYSIVWEGGLVADKTGRYEFRLSTENGARLYFNLDPQQALQKLRDDSSAAGQKALIDAWVGSGQKREQSAQVFLLGGRTYPIRLEFFKYMEKTASVKLMWKPPQGAWEVLDHHHTTTLRPPRVFVCETTFPADDRSEGFERGGRASKEWLDATANAAVAAAAECVQRLPLLAKIPPDSADRVGLAKEFILKFAATAYRRPLTSVESRVLAGIPFDKAPDLEAAVRRAVLMVLMSPHFLYTNPRPAGEALTSYEVASRLSLALWDSIPDPTLWTAADSGQLETREQLEAQAMRMLDDQRAKSKMRAFFENWLELDERDVAKDKRLFPEFDETVAADLRRSLELFIDKVVWSDESDYRQLLLADYLVLNGRLRKLYDRQPPSSLATPGEPSTTAGGADGERDNADFQSMTFPATERCGVLTHPYLLSAFAYHNNTSPIHRGVFLTRNIVGRELRPPPMAIAFKDNEFAADLTMREKISLLTRDAACMSCHSVINPLGFALENFDAIGRWRTSDNNKPVDSRSTYTTGAGEAIHLSSARDIANYAVSSQSAHRAFVKQVFVHLVKQYPGRYGPDVVEQLRSQFADNDFNVQKLWIDVAAFAATNHPAVDEPLPPQPSKVE